MDMQKPGPRRRSSNINPGPGAAVECKTPGVARAGCWCLELTDALLFLEDNGTVFFCLLTVSSGKSIVFDNSDHIKCLLIGTCRPYTVTYVDDATYTGFFLVIVS